MAKDCPECEICCAVGLCCPAGSQRQLDAVVSAIKHKHPTWHTVQVHSAATAFLVKHDYFRGTEELILAEGTK